MIGSLGVRFWAGMVLLFGTFLFLALTGGLPFYPRVSTVVSPLATVNGPQDNKVRDFGKVATSPASLRVPILTYHYVSVPPDASDSLRVKLSVRPEFFARQMRYLSEKGYTTITLGDLLLAVDGKIRLPDKPVILTFDDGYRDFYTNAFPVLKQYGFRSTIFVIYNSMGLSGNLTRDQIRELFKSGLVDVGAHTISHPHLASLATDSARREIVESKERLSQELEIPIAYFSYPYGSYSTENIEMVRSAGFAAAVTLNRGFVHTKKDVFTLHRITVGQWDDAVFAKRISE